MKLNLQVGTLSLALLVACAPSLAGQVDSLLPTEKSVFEQFAGKRCEVIAKASDGNETRFERDCRLLENLAKGTSEACSPSSGPRPVAARFPGRAEVMRLCGEKATPLALEQATKVRFAVLGDFGVGENKAKGHAQLSVAKRLKKECASRENTPACAFVVTVGDNIYPDGVPDVFSPLFAEVFEQVYKDLPPLPFYLVAGNHDHNGNMQAQIEYSYFSERWRMPARNYALEGLPSWLRIHLIDTEPMEETTQEDAARLREVHESLCGSATTSAPWRFLVGHHPIAASGHHGPSESQQAFSEKLAKTCPGVVRLSGHEHHQEHIFDASKGVHQIVQGGGGALVKPFTPGLYKHAPTEEKVHFAISDHGFTVIEAEENALRIAFFALSSEVPVWTCDMPSHTATPRCTGKGSAQGVFP